MKYVAPIQLLYLRKFHFPKEKGTISHIAESLFAEGAARFLGELRMPHKKPILLLHDTKFCSVIGCGQNTWDLHSKLPEHLSKWSHFRHLNSMQKLPPYNRFLRAPRWS